MLAFIKVLTAQSYTYENSLVVSVSLTYGNNILTFRIVKAHNNFYGRLVIKLKA